MKPVRTTCAYCGVGCGIAAKATGPRSVEIAGDKAHPANFGSLCSKGTWLGETLGLEGRLLHPMIGEQQVGWDAALEEVVGRLRQTIAEHGPQSVAFYLSGQLLTEDYYIANKLAKGFIGSPHVDTNSRLCMASAVAAHNRAFGEDVVPCSYDDLDEADLILLVGSNTAWCHPVIWQRIERAREARGTKIVVIDPRRTETAAGADLHIPIAPDGDVALFNALLAAMQARELVDTSSCDEPKGFWECLSQDSGIDAVLFARLADMVAAQPRMITLFSQGANQSVCGTDKGNAVINLHLATGRINQPGTGPFSITGQPNAMGGREVGGLANMLACHLGFSDAEHADVAEFWQAPALVEGPGLKAVDMFRAVHDGRIKFLWVMATNPAVSMPDATFAREALARCPTVVVSEVMADTDTARQAHIRLPALGWAEKDGTVTNSERRISRQRKLLEAPGEARADWRILCDVARLLGHGSEFAHTSPADVYREYAAMTALAVRHGKVLDLTATATISDDEFEAMEPFQWGGRFPLAKRFSTPSGKAQIVAVSPPQKPVNAGFPLRLNTGRYRDQWHTMTRTGLSPKLSQHRREPLVEVHPDDAAASGLADSALAMVSTPKGASIYRVCVTADQAAGQIFVPMHFTDTNSGGGRTGRLMHAVTDPVSGQPAFKDMAAKVAAFSPDWRGFLVSSEAITPQAAYWAQSRIEGGWLTELAGLGAVDIDALLPTGLRSQVSDLGKGMQRIAVQVDDGALAAILYLTRSGTLPDRGWIVRQFAGSDGSMVELLAGRPAQPQEDHGAVVCLCHDVGARQIEAAVRGGASTVAQVGACTRAGTNCGSCRPLVAKLIEQAIAMEPAQ